MVTPTDIRESFPSLEDASGVGVPLTKSTEGDAAAGKVGSVGFAFKDASGNIILPALDAQGRLPVSTDTQGTRLRQHGGVPGGLLSATGAAYGNLQTVLTIPLTANKVIGDLAGKVSCRRGAFFKAVYQDAGGSIVTLDSTILDAGQYTAPLGLGPNEDTFTVPASATSPALVVQAGNFSTISDLHATVSVLQF